MTFTYINGSEETDFGSEELIWRLAIAVEQGDSIRRNVAETPRMKAHHEVLVRHGRVTLVGRNVLREQLSEKLGIPSDMLLGLVAAAAAPAMGCAREEWELSEPVCELSH